MSAHLLRLSLLVLGFGAASSCIYIEETKDNFCRQEQNQDICFTPIIDGVSKRNPFVEGAVIFSVAARDPSPDKHLTFTWSVEKNLGLFEPTRDPREILWHYPPCMPQAADGSHGVVIEVTATNLKGYYSTKNVKFEIPLLCPEWTRFTMKDLEPTYGNDSASHTATRLKSGRVLVAGGLNEQGSIKSAEIFYGPVSSSSSVASNLGWEKASPMGSARSYHAAELMDSGKVLITGGQEVIKSPEGKTESRDLRSVEEYDPTAPVGEQWTTTQPMALVRQKHTATRLPSGNVLVVGGLSDGDPTHFCEEYSPKSKSWSQLSRMASARAGHTATFLPSTGKVLVIGGFEPAASASGNVRASGDVTAANIAFATGEMYDPNTQTWTPLKSSMKEARYFHTATLLPSGKVLITGGFNERGPLATSEIYDPVTEQWAPAGNLLTARGQHTAVLLTTGEVLIAAGVGATGPLSSTEFFSAHTLTWSPGSSLHEARTQHSATLLVSGSVLVTGGIGPEGYVTATELYTPTKLAPRSQSSWIPAGDLLTAEAGHTATKLPSGKVLVAGGYGFTPGYTGAVLYDSTTSMWFPAGNMGTSRDDHTATLLPSGKVLVAGGDALGSSKLYDPVTDSWSDTGMLSSPRELHTATLLLSGKILVAGGDWGMTALASAELYDPATGLWSPTGDMTTARERHTATLLPSGKVLVTGGAPSDGGNALDSAEIYDPDTGTWTATTNMPFAAVLHRATLLHWGTVLVAGGTNGTILDPPGKSAVLYDPMTETWMPVGDMNQARSLYTATLLPSGKVLVTGGDLDSVQTSTAELYDPFTGFWFPTASLSARRFNHTATLLSSGNVLVTGGVDFSPLVSAFLPSTEVYLPLNENSPPAP